METLFLPAAYGADLTNEKVKKSYFSLSGILLEVWTYINQSLRYKQSQREPMQIKQECSTYFFSNTNKGLYSKHLFHTSPVLHKPRFTSSDADEVRCNLTDKKLDVAIIRTEYESQ